ncbi:hypothetical protein GMORB2_3952 [Geosmithia morbida]|uniref:Uncharacterized protein n=1 Tax=Geosmithia morbida TaxID=1094350 RepID=A0A9P4Z0N1_9HYPO|nr:uncharacterized protein GMORB2_3952 [Geosmithia morbida]KAF4125113.1 hypothetical protein GMORB2_3952 [Geosmithia morbida]
MCRRARPADLDQATRTVVQMSPYFRQFSTSPYFLADEPASRNSSDSAPSPARQRSQANVNEIKSLAANRPAQTGGAIPPQQQQQPKVVDIRSLPRGGLRGRGGAGFRGSRGGAGVRGGRGSASRPTGDGSSRFAGQSGARGGGRGGAARGAQRGRKGGRGASAQGAARRRKQGGEGEEDGARSFRDDRYVDESELVEPSEHALEQAMRFGVETTYKPELTRESLAREMPAVPSSSTGPAARIHESLSALGTADRVGRPAGLTPAMYALDLKERGLRYFADTESRQRTEEYMQRVRREKALAAGKDESAIATDPIIRDLDEEARKAILDGAVAGRHDTLEYATDPVGISRNWHLRSETWGPKERKAFEAKLSTMLAKSKQAAPKKKEAKA